MRNILNFEYTTDQKKEIDSLLKKELDTFKEKIVILDDDPTGTQTVNGIKVYCDWEEETITDALEKGNKSFFILTNSRSFSYEETVEVHKEIANNLFKNKEKFLIYSRGDSTLRGHYPIETETVKNEYEKFSNEKIDGEIICPAFIEGKRVTIHGVHYIIEQGNLIPVGETEFAKDKTFSYKNSDLGKWCEEKTNKRFLEKDIIKIYLEDLREININKVLKQIFDVKNFNKIIVDALNYYDLKVFTICMLKAINLDKRFIIRGAASLAKVLVNCEDKDFLTKNEILNYKTKNGGIILVGSHVSKTTKQLEELKKSDICQVEFNQHLILNKKKFNEEIERVIKVTENLLEQGKNVVVYTRRERFDLPNGTEEEQLKIATEISHGLIKIIENLKLRPSFIISKGGITSSDVATKSLKIKEAIVLGQIVAGIPVWLSGEKSKYPKLPYIIFPGNVGEEETLKLVYEKIKN